MSLIAAELTVEGRLEEVTVAMQTGQVTAICGPNGAGKSTLLQCLAGLLPTEGGLVALDHRPLDQMRSCERAQTIGYLPQNGEIAWDLTVRNLVSLGRLPHRDRGEAEVAEALSALDLDPFAERPVSQLSGGERARALLARVLAGTPRWILADEPLAALDIAHQLALIGHFRRTARKGVGVVLVLHDLALAMNYADRVIVLDRGEKAADGDPQVALSEDVIARVWGVPARWLGEPGARALIPG